MLTLAACASVSQSGGRRESADLAAATRAAAEFRTASYKIGSADVLNVSVYPDPQFNRRARVEADGGLSLPLIGTVKVTGLTIEEARRALERRLAAYLVNPHVALVIEEFGNRQLFVLGEVHRPGSYPIPAGSAMTALQAISVAGGFTDVAAAQRTHVLRKAGGRAVDRLVDLKAVTAGKVDGDVVLEPNDIIYVPESFF